MCAYAWGIWVLSAARSRSARGSAPPGGAACTCTADACSAAARERASGRGGGGVDAVAAATALRLALSPAEIRQYFRGAAGDPAARRGSFRLGAEVESWQGQAHSAGEQLACVYWLPRALLRSCSGRLSWRVWAGRGLRGARGALVRRGATPPRVSDESLPVCPTRGPSPSHSDGPGDSFTRGDRGRHTCAHVSLGHRS